MNGSQRLSKRPWYDAIWQYLHSISFWVYEAISFNRILDGMEPAIICPNCRQHMREFRSQTPVPQSGMNLAFFRWTVDFHNHVNTKLGKPVLSMDDAMQVWSDEVILDQSTFGQESLMNRATIITHEPEPNTPPPQ